MGEKKTSKWRFTWQSEYEYFPIASIAEQIFLYVYLLLIFYVTGYSLVLLSMSTLLRSIDFYLMTVYVMKNFFVKLPLKWLFIWGMTFHPSGDSHLSEVFFVPLAYMSKYIGYFYIFIVLFNSLFSFEFQIINKHLHCLVLQYEFYFYTE